MNECLNCQAQLPPGATGCPACGAGVPLWLARGGQTLGPYTLAALRQARAEGRIGPDDQIMIGNEGVWQPVAAVLPPAPAKPSYGMPPAPPPPPPPRTAAAIQHRKSQGNQQLLIILLVAGGVLLMFGVMMAAIMFPVFSKAREKARQSSCLSNVKQLSLGMLMYAQDYDERFPPKPLSQTSQRLEDRRLNAGMGEKPDPQRDYPPRDWRRDIFPYAKNLGLFACPTTLSSYSYQCNPAIYGLRLGDVHEPQRLIMLYDAGLLDGSAPPPHDHGYNAGFVDGHCRWVRGKQGYLTAP